MRTKPNYTEDILEIIIQTEPNGNHIRKKAKKLLNDFRKGNIV